MIYRFEDFELDTATFELRRGGSPLAAEPQVLSLLILLVQNPDRLLAKDEIIEKIWNGRIVSDAAVSSRIKSIRKLLGDDGRAQRLVKTVHGKGFRFIGSVSASDAANQPDEPAASRSFASAAPVESLVPSAGPPEETPLADKPSIAVLPFRLVGVAGQFASLADALPHELILELARSRWIMVIARGSSFRFRDPDPDLQNIGRTLRVRYCLSGVVEVVGNQISVSVDLADTRDGAVVWGERYKDEVGAVHDIRDRIIANIVTALEFFIPHNEARHARQSAAPHLDAWSAYHLGLDHMYRFNRLDNARASELFARAIALDPTFARAHAGMSFTRFQNAFLRYSEDVGAEIAGARASAEAAVSHDPLDPFANLVLGRAHWIEGDLQASLAWLERSTEISPHYAHGVYLRGLTEAMAGRGADSNGHIDLAIRLSPLDPLRYAMLSTRALSLLLQDQYEEAVSWAERAAYSPGAHVHISLVALLANEIAGHRAGAERWAEDARRRSPEINLEKFLQAFPFADGAFRRRIEQSLRSFGF